MTALIASVVIAAPSVLAGRPKVLELGAVVAFVGFTVVALVADPSTTAWLARYARAIAALAPPTRNPATVRAAAAGSSRGEGCLERDRFLLTQAPCRAWRTWRPVYRTAKTVTLREELGQAIWAVIRGAQPQPASRGVSDFRIAEVTVDE